jgi:hypothetical protein
MKYEIIIFFFLILFYSCRSKEKDKVLIFSDEKNIKGNDTFEILESYYDDGTPFEIKNLKNGLLHGIQTRIDQDGKVDFIQSYHYGNLYGPYKLFYKGGTHVKRFEYIVDSTFATFIRNYDANGKLIKEEGNPLVNYIIHFDQNTGIIRGKFKLCYFESKYIKFEIALEGESYIELKNAKNSEIDLTKEIDFLERVKNVKKIKIFVRITSIGFDSSSKIYFDTLVPNVPLHMSL